MKHLQEIKPGQFKTTEEKQNTNNLYSFFLMLATEPKKLSTLFIVADEKIDTKQYSLHQDVINNDELINFYVLYPGMLISLLMAMEAWISIMAHSGHLSTLSYPIALACSCLFAWFLVKVMEIPSNSQSLAVAIGEPIPEALSQSLTK